MDSGRKRRFTVFAGTACLAASAVLAGCSLGDDAALDTTRPRQTGTTAAGTTDTTADSFDVFATRDPFEPVIEDGTPPPTSPGTTTPGGTAPTTTPTTSPSFEPPAGQAVSLLDVFQETDGTEQARVQVGSTVYTVGEGEVFATSYRVVSLDEPCGVFQYGDAQFELCEGEQVIK